VWQLGLEEYLALIVVIALLALGIVYFVVIPYFGMRKVLQHSSITTKGIAFFGYYCLFAVFAIVIFLLPDYALKTYNYDFGSTQLFIFLLFLFLTLPLSYLVGIEIIFKKRNGWTEK
jgi:hypothetical protein